MKVEHSKPDRKKVGKMPAWATGRVALLDDDGSCKAASSWIKRMNQDLPFAGQAQPSIHRDKQVAVTGFLERLGSLPVELRSSVSVVRGLIRSRKHNAGPDDADHHAGR